jgi:hypothetical protein
MENLIQQNEFIPNGLVQNIQGLKNTIFSEMVLDEEGNQRILNSLSKVLTALLGGIQFSDDVTREDVLLEFVRVQNILNITPTNRDGIPLNKNKTKS